MFQHYIITRFNLRRDDWNLTKNNEKVLSDDWLKDRFELFENYCFPSIKNQINQNFLWLVFFDLNTPQKYKDKIENYKLEFKNFYPFFIDGMQSFLPSIIKSINELDDKPYIITSRLDNDDSLHQDYVKVVQSYFDKQDQMAIDFIDGYTLKMDNSILIGYKKFMYNPYISLIERKENYKTVWHLGHTHWKYEKNVINIKNKRLWITIIHNKNKANKFYGYGKVPPKILSNFNIKPSIIEEITLKCKPYNSWVFLNVKNALDNFMFYYSKRMKRHLGFYKLKSFFAKNKYD